MTTTPPGLNEVLQRTFSFPKKHFLSATDLNEVEVANLLDLADGFVALNRQTSKKLDLLITTDDTPKHKPDPMPLVKTCEALAAERTVEADDADHDERPLRALDASWVGECGEH